MVALPWYLFAVVVVADLELLFWLGYSGADGTLHFLPLCCILLCSWSVPVSASGWPRTKGRQGTGLCNRRYGDGRHGNGRHGCHRNGGRLCLGGNRAPDALRCALRRLRGRAATCASALSKVKTK